ncbi:MAG TPA: peptidoglycan-binding protein [Caulobacteraceae bacterium]|nr:peptidoglycan-binding protein [Caulobacteraceae bacterium]
MSAEPRYETLGHPADEISRVTQAIERLSDRISTAESRQALAIAGIERSVREVIDRLDSAEREQMQVAARFEGDLQDVRAQTVKMADRLRQLEDEAAGPRSAEALRALESALGKVASHVYEGDKHAREMLSELRSRVDRIDAAGDATTSAIAELKQSCTALDDRLALGESGAEVGVEQAAENLSNRVEAVREELGRQLSAATDARFDRVEQALAEMSEHVRTAERRSAGAIERMGREVLDVAQLLNRRVQAVEHGSADAAGRMSAEMSRIAGAVEDRLARADNIQAQALEKLGGEIARITERLAERIANAERRSAQAIDDVGEQVARVTERIGQRSDRATSELVERIRQSEERTARLLDEARQKIDERLADGHRRLAEAARSATDYDDPDESLFGEAPFPGFETPPAEAASPVAEMPADDARTFDEPAAVEPEPAVSAPTIAKLEPTVFDDEDFAAAALFEPKAASEPDAEPAPETEPEPRAAVAWEPTPQPVLETAPEPAAALSEPQPAAPASAAPAMLPDLEDVELEPNIGFDVEDELVGPATHAFGHVPPSAEAIAPAATEPTAAHEEAPFAPAHEEPAPAQAALSDDEPTPDAEQPQLAAEADEESIEEAPALTTRDVIERARAAARAANGRDGLGRAGTRSADSVLQSVAFGHSQRKPGGTTGALLVASVLAAVGLSAGGYMVLEGKPGGKLPKRVSDALAVVQGQSPDASPAGAGSDSAPLAAVALAPKPAAQAPATPDTSAAYSAAVAKITAGEEAGGVADLRKLADDGYAPAQFYIAELYQDGKAGLKKDPTAARQWLQKAAEGGDRTAMHNLALDMHEGIGGARNAVAAAEWFRRAAELGLLDSQFNLAAIYEHGDGVSQNPAEAYKWYLIAGRSGDTEARAGAVRMRASLTPDARSVAERAAAEFQPQTPNASTLPAAAVAAAAPQTTAPDIVTAQRALNQLGYYQGPTDGTASPALKLAIAAYQRDQGLPVSGAPDAATIGKLSVYTR